MLRSSLLLTVCLGAACAADITVDRSGAANTFDGIGGLSGGGATSRLVRKAATRRLPARLPARRPTAPRH